MLYFYAILIGIVEGLTEFLPVSSTGHMIIVDQFFNPSGISKEFKDSFLIAIQLGAIISVVIYFFKDLSPFVKDKDKRMEKINLWSKIVVATLPAVVLGLSFDDYISKYLMDNTYIVSIMLIIYGIIFLFIEKKLKGREKIFSLNDISYKAAIAVGFFQCLAMVPGTSRSGATIIGALFLGFNRAVAAEFSFFLAIPIMFGATLLKLLKSGMSFTFIEWQILIIGSITAFIVAFIVIKWLMGYIKKRNFVIFGYYRIFAGIIVLILLNYVK